MALFGLVAVVAAACGASEGGAAPGDARRGRQLFVTQACAGCHVVESLRGADGSIGPELSNIGSEAETRVAGQDAQTYLRTAIVFPNAFVVKGYEANVMPLDYGESLSLQQRRDLVAYLLSLR
ncbi:MAG TPA: cytochrome c [Ardenticatenaceae bacterium]|nr:cytochrome c [Ardenticatenaceae bacterium]